MCQRLCQEMSRDSNPSQRGHSGVALVCTNVRYASARPINLRQTANFDTSTFKSGGGFTPTNMLIFLAKYKHRRDK